VLQVDVAARIRDGELGSIRVLLAEGLGGQALKSLDERGRAQELVRQQYSGRYPFELLQNASDAAVEAGISGRACFTLTDTALIVADNGSGFGERQVEGICSLGRSPKAPGAAIGHKGLGFKSVGEITNRPQVISSQAAFQFDGERVRAEMLGLFGSLPGEQKFPVYAFPFPVLDDDLNSDAEVIRQLGNEGFGTIIRLPLREGVTGKVVAAHLMEALLPRLLLFLPGIDELELRGTEADFAVQVIRDDEQRAEHVLLDSGEACEEWLIYRGSAVPEQAVLVPMGEAWTRVEKVSFAIAVPLDESGTQPRVDETFPLHVYFPTEEQPGLHVAVHAEWALGIDRRRLAVAPEAEQYNDMLLEEVARFAADDVATDLVTRFGNSAAAVQAVVPAMTGPAYGAGEKLRGLWASGLAAAPFLPFADGALRAPAATWMLPATLPSFQDAHALAVLDEESVLRADIEALAPVRAFVSGVSARREMGFREFLSRMRPPAPETASEYYSFLIRWRESSGYGGRLVEELGRHPSVLTVNGQALAPRERAVFLPRQRGAAAIPDDLGAPIAETLGSEPVEDFLKALGVKPFEWRDLIRDFLIKILADDGADPRHRDLALDALRAYHADRRSGSDDLFPVLATVLLPARTADGTGQQLAPAGTLYFGADWTGSDDLEVIYGPFGRAEFLALTPPSDLGQKQDDRGFYGMLGVVDHPRLDEARATRRDEYPAGGTRHPHRGPLFTEWRAQPGVAEQASCPAHEHWPQQLHLSVRLDRHLELTETGEPARLFALWRQLARGWGRHYATAMTAVFRCSHGWHGAPSDRECESLFAYTLRSKAWVPVDRAGKPDLVRPADAWIDAGATETPRRIRGRIPRISDAMYRTRGAKDLIEALRLTDVARPAASDLLALMDAIACEADEAGVVSRDAELAARWVQRTLDDILGGEQAPHPQPEQVRLLASHNGALGFVPGPPYADDPLLRDTWEKQRPVLAAEAGLTRLARFLALTRLDDEVRVSAEPFGVHPPGRPAFDAARLKIDRVKPYLLALVKAESSRNEPRTRSALQRLEIVICDDLVLHYEYDGTRATRADAVCYIAASQDRARRRQATTGTAYLEIDPATGQPHWFSLGRPLAQHLGTPTLADAITMLLTARPQDRDRMMAERQIPPQHLTEAHEQLRLLADDDDPIRHVLDGLLPGAGPEASTDHEEGNSPAPQPEQGDETLPEPAPPAPVPVTESEPQGPPKPIVPPPPVDYDKVQIIDAKPGSLAPSPSPGHVQPHGYGGGYSTAPQADDAENKRVGRRGEEITFTKEQERIRALDLPADSVVWVSRTDELSPYDIRSLNRHGQVIYIEVKSTRGSDPSEEFIITKAELDLARLHRDRYYIYRVTSTDTATPTITRAADPLGLVLDGKADLHLKNARMTIAFDHSQGG
jgi:uncharacterized protein DUF3883